MKCQKFIFTHNGNTYEFNSENELSSFITNNKNRLEGLKIDPSIKLSKDYNTQSEVYASLLKLGDIGVKTEYTDFGDKKLEYSDHISVTKAITMGELWEDGKPLVPGMNQEDYFEELTKTLKSTLNPNTSKLYTDPEILEHIEGLKIRWKQMAKFGTAIHKITEIFFKDTSQNKEDIIKSFSHSREAKDVNFGVSEIDNMINYVLNVHEQLLKRYPNAKFIPELKLRTTNPGGPNFVGKIDLLVVTETGEVHVFDFKTSPVNYTNYSQIKDITFAYQLGFYRHMLGQAGYNMRNSELGILPIELSEVDYDNNTIKSIKTDGVIDVRTSSEGGSKYKSKSFQNLLPGGKISQKLDRLIPSKKLEFALNTDISEKFDKINKELFGYDSENNSGLRSKKALDEVKGRIKQNQQGSFVVKDDFTGEIKYCKTREQAEKIVEENFLKNQNNKLYYSQEVANNYRAALNSNHSSFNFKKDANKTNNYNAQYGTYLKEGWKLNEGLLPHGILVFYHEQYKTVDFIYINNEDLANKVTDLTFGRNGTLITGNLIPDREAPKHTLDAVVGNVELMRLMVAVNEFMPSISEDYEVNNLYVINHFNYKMAYQNTNTLRHNFKILVQKANQKKNLGIVNNFENIDKTRSIKFVDGVHKLMSKLDVILNDDSTEKYHFLNDIKEGLHQVHDKNVDVKIKRLIQLSEEVANYAMGYTGKILDPVNNLDDPITKVYYAINDAIREARNLYFIYQFSDIPKVSGHSEILAPAQLSTIKIIDEVQHKIIDVGKSKMQRRYNEEGTSVKVFCEDYLKKNNSIDSSLNAFDNLIERHEGQVSIFRVKDPRTSNMLDYQKEFLNNWLTTINKIRFPQTNGDRDSPEARELVSSGQWFDIPLKEGGVVNKGVKGIRKSFTDFLEKFNNPMMVLSKSSRKSQNEQLNKFQQYVNPLKIIGTDRDNFIGSEGINYFSRDLAEIAMDYLYHDVLEYEYNEMLPYIRSALICAHVVDMFTKSEMTDALKIMLEKYQTEVYKVNHISAGAEPLYKAYMVLDTLANAFTLVNNPISFVREMTTGRYSNYGRILTQFGGRDAPNVEHLTKAYVFTDLQGVSALFNQNVMNAFNMRWNIGGRAMTEMKESHRVQRSSFFNLAFKSSPGYTLSQIPDYEHRMALFIAYMYKEGCMDAYSYDEKTQRLIYNFDKDPRFKYVKEYAKTGKAPNNQMDNIAKYQMLLEEYNEHADEKLKFGDDLKDGISENKVKTIKNVSNQIHGNLDSDTCMHWRRYFSGKIFTKFQTFLSAKILNFTLTPGKYQMMEENYEVDDLTGKPLYLKRVYNPETQGYDFEYTTDIKDPDCTGQRVLKQQERQEAGTLYAILDMFEILSDPENRSERWLELTNNEAKIANLKFMIGDLILLLLMSILGAGLSLPELRRDNKLAADVLNAMVINPTRENNPIILMSNALGIIDSPTISINKKAINKTIDYLTNEDTTTKEYLYNFGFGKYSGFF